MFLLQNKLLDRLVMTLKDIGLIEVNTAFEAPTSGVLKELELSPVIINVDVGAIAMGHPLGCWGTRILTTFIHQMKKQKTQYGFATLRVDVEQCISILVELV